MLNGFKIQSYISQPSCKSFIKILTHVCSIVICVVHLQYWNTMYHYLESFKTKYTFQQHNFTEITIHQSPTCVSGTPIVEHIV